MDNILLCTGYQKFLYDIFPGGIGGLPVFYEALYFFSGQGDYKKNNGK
jgi:hypothetical protein